MSTQPQSAADKALYAYAYSQVPPDAKINTVDVTWRLVAGISEFAVIISYNLPGQDKRWKELDAQTTLAAILTMMLGLDK